MSKTKTKKNQIVEPQFAVGDIVEYRYNYDVDRGGNSSFNTMVGKIVMIEGNQAVVRVRRNSKETELVTVWLENLLPVWLENMPRIAL